MKANQLPKTDSIHELAQFWDSHDVTDFENELEEVTDQVFDRDATFSVQLPLDMADALRRLADAKSVAPSELIKVWVVERVEASIQD